MAVPAMIGWHDSAALYRGLADTFESFEPALRRLGCTTHLGDAPGLASPHDITLLGATYGLFSDSLHTNVPACTEGARATEFTPSLLIPTMMAYPLKLPTPVNGRDFLTIESNFAAQAVPVANVIGATRSQGIRAGLIEPVWDLTERRVPRPAMMEEASSVVEEMSG